MPTKTISLEMDAYEKLRSAKRSGESFSAVVRRASFDGAPPSGLELREYIRSGGARVSERYLKTAEEASAHDRIPEYQWMN